MPAALLQLNTASMLPTTIMKNQAFTQVLSQALKNQLLNGAASGTSPLDLSSKKDDSDAEQETPSDPQTSIAKIEEIDELESADTRVSV